jgi:hypothetical protein
MVRGALRLPVPNAHEGDIGPDLLSRILRLAGISHDEWESKEEWTATDRLRVMLTWVVEKLRRSGRGKRLVWHARAVSSAQPKSVTVRGRPWGNILAACSGRRGQGAACRRNAA